MRCCWVLSETPRGAREGAPRRDTTMTQNSDSGDAVGRRGTYNRQAGNMATQGEKTVYESVPLLGKFCLLSRGLAAAAAVRKALNWTPLAACAMIITRCVEGF